MLSSQAQEGPQDPSPRLRLPGRIHLGEVLRQSITRLKRRRSLRGARCSTAVGAGSSSRPLLDRCPVTASPDPTAETMTAQGHRKETIADRQRRVLDDVLQQIGRSGAEGVTHRSITRSTGIPLGSLTYYFNSRDAMLLAAFERWGVLAVRRLEEALSSRAGQELATVLGDYVEQELRVVPPAVVVRAELFAAALRDERFRRVAESFTFGVLAALRTRLGAEEALLCRSVLDGVLLHRSVDVEAVREVVRAVVGDLERSDTPR
ncbi:TetR/AcrR family transcriptional regulator [Kineococcus aurantiacus]|uniref:DNA-binding transcriptional regulator YbjK n=1 Tax=Kineococcus aurantiacus TaxID=37633 RepID=A0A7Y9DQT6_9ACTN|nr:TetR family transcriptional regulator [Kineococcus aurantiacus]NYD25110.1 DNA-binding transcriptional regulator YbjK [Kineococcus aurantiacus]